ncbi:hypothetical protein BZA77DRAFT_292907 [Pyronema omphalodes]|nr:hypothetical protein BZA77DRAFT_292907 [Pyronema omphalodes]
MTDTHAPTPPPATDSSMPPPPRPSPPIVFAPKPLRIPTAYLPLVARTPSPAPAMARRGSIQEEGAMRARGGLATLRLEAKRAKQSMTEEFSSFWKESKLSELHSVAAYGDSGTCHYLRLTVLQAGNFACLKAIVAYRVDALRLGSELWLLPTTEANNNNILDDFLKIVRSQREGRKTVSPLNLRRREEGRERPLIPASPVSRQLARNPMIFNTQFEMMPEEDTS